MIGYIIPRSIRVDNIYSFNFEIETTSNLSNSLISPECMCVNVYASVCVFHKYASINNNNNDYKGP